MLAQPEKRQRQVLVVNSENSLIPLVAQVNQDLVESIKSELGRDTEIFVEWLDTNRFLHAGHDTEVADFLQKKYSTQKLEGVIVVTEAALRFAAKHRALLFPDVPIVHLGIRASEVGRWNSEPKIYGAGMDYDIAPTLEFALKVHPEVRRVVVITGVSPTDKGWEAVIRSGIPPFAGRVGFDFWSGLPMAEVLDRLAGLERDAIVFTPSVLCDGAGEWMLGAESLEKMTAASARPIYSMFAERMVRGGGIGGIGPDFGSLGAQTARILAQVLSGRESEDSGTVVPFKAFFNWGQLQRWKIKEKDLPAGSVVLFRVPGFFEAYWGRVLAAGAIILIQSGFIMALLVQRRRRRLAERELAVHRQELTHLTRVFMLGELTGTLSHEFSQPLSTMLTSARAAQRYAAADGGPPEVRELLQTILHAGQRASGLLERLRAMIRRDPPQHQPLDLNEVTREVLALMRGELSTRQVAARPSLSAEPLMVRGDAVQLQQVLVNLLFNACEAMTEQPAATRRIDIHTQASLEASGLARLTVSDHGTGLDAEARERLFDSFFTTKPSGLGLGLSICRQIAADHGGTLHAENGRPAGLTLVFQLPLHPAA